MWVFQQRFGGDVFMTDKLIGEMHKMLHKIDRNMAAVEQHLKQINGRLDKHEEDIDKNSQFRFKFWGAVTIVSVLVPLGISLLVAWLTG